MRSDFCPHSCLKQHIQGRITEELRALIRKAVRPGFESWLCQLLAGCPGCPTESFLGLCILTCKIRKVIMSLISMSGLWLKKLNVSTTDVGFYPLLRKKFQSFVDKTFQYIFQICYALLVVCKFEAAAFVLIVSEMGQHHPLAHKSFQALFLLIWLKRFNGTGGHINIHWFLLLISAFNF